MSGNLKNSFDLAGKNPEELGQLLIAEIYKQEDCDVGVVRALAELNASLETKGGNGCTALFLSAWYGLPEVMTILLDAGANFNTPNDDKDTPLIGAIISDFNEEHKADIVRLLLERHPDLTARGWAGYKAMDWARNKRLADIAAMIAAEGRAQGVTDQLEAYPPSKNPPADQITVTFKFTPGGS